MITAPRTTTVEHEHVTVTTVLSDRTWHPWSVLVPALERALAERASRELLERYDAGLLSGQEG